MISITLIAAIGRRGQVGMADGSLPWGDAFPEDRREFRRKTAGGILIAGWCTWRSVPVPSYDAATGRQLILDPREAAPEGVVEVLQRNNSGRPIWIIGGPKTWVRWEHLLTRRDVTVLDFDGPADVWWPFRIPEEASH